MAIYIYGWRRLSPWAHFWTGVPIVIAGILGSASVIAANAWMNDPDRVHPRRLGEHRRGRPVGGHLQRRHAAHGGPHDRGRLRGRRLPGRVRLRLRPAARGAATGTTGSGSSSPSPWPRSPSSCRWRWATPSPAGCTRTSRPSSRRSRWSTRPRTTCPRSSSGRLHEDGTVSGGIRIPGLASWLSDPGTGSATVVQGLDGHPGRRTTHRPPGQHRAPRLGRHDRARHPALPALGLVRRSPGCAVATSRGADGSSASPPPPGCCPSSPWRPAGS